MSYTVTSFPQGTFSWADFFSTDVEKTKTFLHELFGWTSQDMPTGEGRPDYTMFYLDGKVVTAGSQAFDPKQPSFWSNYITVDDVEAMTARAVSLGGSVMMPPMQVLEAGKMSVITDPTGANVSLWQPQNHQGAAIVNTVGAMCWNELYTPDIKKAKQFYSDLFGWTYETDPDNDYLMIKNNGRSNGGMMPITPEMMGMPPCWMVYFTVADIEASVKRAAELGGSVHLPPMKVGVGTIAMIAEPAGASFMLIQMSVTPDHWEN